MKVCVCVCVRARSSCCPLRLRVYECLLVSHAGTVCETEVTTCAPLNPCLRGGRCFQDARGVFCQCPDGFEGIYCELVIRECGGCEACFTLDTSPVSSLAASLGRASHSPAAPVNFSRDATRVTYFDAKQALCARESGTLCTRVG